MSAPIAFRDKNMVFNILKWIWNNISAIKDIFWIIFTLIYDDISINLKQILEEFVLKVYCKSKNGEKFGINPIGVYNAFNEKRHINSKLIERVREETREYLMIDKKW